MCDQHGRHFRPDTVATRRGVDAGSKLDGRIASGHQNLRPDRLPRRLPADAGVGPAVFGIAFFHPGNPVSANSTDLVSQLGKIAMTL